MIEWNIQSRAHACQACAMPFADRQPYHTLLSDERAGYERFDVCEACWAAQYSQGATDRRGFVSHWQGVYEVPQVQPDPIQKETAETLLRKLVEGNDPGHGAACFILAVMLERKRILKVREQTQREGRRTFLYEHVRTGDLFTIADPDLRLDQLDEVQRDVSRLLEEGLAPAVAATPADLAAPAGEAPVLAPEAPAPAGTGAEPAAASATVNPASPA
jgi:hypothetical protein